MAQPADADVEVHVFGPGYGESVLVHLGFNDWLIVDSCVARGSKVPAPIAYLDGIGVDPATAVKVIVASHWHDDHVRGLATVLQRSTAAEFWCSGALLERDFVTLMAAVTTRPMLRAGTGLDEMSGVVEELKRRSTGARVGGIGLHFAESDKLIWQRREPSEHTTRVHSLSPSSAERLLALRTFADLLEEHAGTPRRPKGRVRAVGPNNSAVALHIDVGPATILLGADLEELGTPPLADCGWTAVVASPRRPVGRSTLFKIAHHGSETAHCDRVWTDMLTLKPLALLTPFRRGKVNLPTRTDAERIRARAGAAYVSARQATRKAKPANPVVSRELVQSTRAVWEASPMGHVAARIPAGRSVEGWQVTMHGGAERL